MIPFGPGQPAVEIIEVKLKRVLRIVIRTGRTDIQRDIRKTKMLVIPPYHHYHLLATQNRKLLSVSM